MGKKYYCDFCDKSFSDNPTNRRNHIKGVLHQKLRNEHYNAYKDPATIYAEEIKKLPCRNFFSRGECKFGTSCIYTHYTPDELQQLIRQAKVSSTTKKRNSERSQPEPSLDDWLKKWKKQRQKLKESHKISGTENSPKPDVREKEIFLPEYKLPASFQGIPNLPPSLLPPPPEVLKSVVFEEWG